MPWLFLWPHHLLLLKWLLTRDSIFPLRWRGASRKWPAHPWSEKVKLTWALPNRHVAPASKITVTVSGPLGVGARSGSVSVGAWMRARPPEETESKGWQSRMKLSLKFGIYSYCNYLLLLNIIFLQCSTIYYFLLVLILLRHVDSLVSHTGTHTYKHTALHFKIKSMPYLDLLAWLVSSLPLTWGY